MQRSQKYEEEAQFESAKGLATATGSGEEARAQVFPDRVSVMGGVVLTLFVLVLVASLAMVCKAMCTIKGATYMRVTNVALTPDQAQQVQQAMPNVPLVQGKNGVTYAQSVVSAPASDYVQGDFASGLTYTFGGIYIFATVFFLISLYWAVKPQPSYVGVVMSIVFGLIWVAAAVSFGVLAQQSLSGKSFGASYLADLLAFVQSGRVLNKQLSVPQTDVTNQFVATALGDSSIVQLVQGTVFGALALLVVFGFIVIAKRS